MVNVGEISNRLDKHIEGNNERLRNIGDEVNDLSLHMQDVQSTLKAILRQVSVGPETQPQPSPNITEQY